MQATNEQNIAVVCNPMAGNGRAVELAKKLVTELCQRNIPNKIFQENWPAHFDSFSTVFIVGGDGTLNYFINLYPQIKVPLAIFRGGSGNDIHWLLYGDKSFAQQLEVVLTTHPRPVDAGQCNGRLFINGVGIGFDGAVAKSLTGKNKLPGKTSFLIVILRKIFLYRSAVYQISSDELSEQSRQLLIGVANGRRAGGGFFIAPEAIATDGLLDVILVNAIRPLKRLRYLPVIEKGKHLHLPFIKYFKTKSICIVSDTLIQAHLDGEYYSDTRLRIEILPRRFLFLY